DARLTLSPAQPFAQGACHGRTTKSACCVPPERPRAVGLTRTSRTFFPPIANIATRHAFACHLTGNRLVSPSRSSRQETES
ncbi:hypothetical protein ACLBYN_14105, partial [Pseudomonas aeruginosa]